MQDESESKKEEQAESKNLESEVTEQRQVYHSSSDEDSDEDEPFVKSKKFDERKASSNSVEKKESSTEKHRIQQKEDNSDSTDQLGRQTILLSATLTHAVEKLAGLAMEHPIFVDAAKENLEITGDETSDLNEDLVVPQSVLQSYVVTPPKLRMVTLSAYIAGKCQVDLPTQRLITFFSTKSHEYYSCH